MANLNNALISLTRLGIGHSADRIAGAIDWEELQTLAEKHGLSAVVVDGLEKLPDDLRPPKMVLLQWIGETLQGYEYRYEQYKKTISELAAFYNSHGFKMMILKGYACALDWSRPEHRLCGDIDIWLFGKQQDADKELFLSFKIQNPSFEIDNSHHHHSVFYWGDFMVENHYDFINVHHHKSNVEFEKLLKGLAADDSHTVVVLGEKVYLPSPNLHALFLLRHMMKHFASEVITLRQLLDWAFFVRAHGKEVDWPWLEGVLDEFGMRRLYDIFNAICLSVLGFHLVENLEFRAKSQMESVEFGELKERVLNEILEPEYSEELPKGLIKRTIFKIRRWKGNAWKHELCYKDSMWSAFWSGVWNHLLKPNSF